MKHAKSLFGVAILLWLGCSSNSNGGFGSSGEDDGGRPVGASSEANSSGAAGSSGQSANSGSGSGGATASSGSGTGSGSGSGGSTGTTSGNGQGMDASNTTGPGDASQNAQGSDANPPEAASTTGDAADALDAARQACVDTINMYRATLNLGALSLAPASIEACSDRGAMQDATTNTPHSSAGMCPNAGGQDTCPDLPIGGGATLVSSLKQCLAQMWAEGPPPSGTTVAQCIQDEAGCFEEHGHYINMSGPGYTWVSCGFYMMSSGDYWANQDFGPLSGSP
jgi:hypothetical protein